MRRLTAGIAITATLGLLAACGTAEEPDASSTTTSSPAGSAPSSGGSAPGTVPSTPSGPTGTAPSGGGDSASPAPDQAAFPADTSTDVGTASADAQLVLVDVRSAAHDGYDRVVLEFSGPGAPGWTAQYADEASRQGSGEQITVDGSALLDITITGSAIPQEGADTVGAGPIGPSGTSVVKDIFNDGTFEGITHVVLGIDGEQPFRVFALAGPPRVVIDVQT